MSKPVDWNVSELLSGPSFCIKPWVHCHISTSGDVQACCVSPISFGNLRENTLAEIWNGERIRRFRAAHLSGSEVAGCERCYLEEEVGAFSMRKDSNERFAAVGMDWVRDTEADGTAPTSRPIDYDIRFSNICNFKCRTCHHGSSSSWYIDQVALRGPRPGMKAIIRAFDTPRDFWSAFGGFIDDVQKLYFAGGEPLLQDEHYQVLEALHQREKFDVLIHYNTNFSVLEHRGVNVTKLWRDFRRLHVAASLDASGDRAELLRHGQSWQAVLDNRERLRRECPHVKFSVACSVSALNAWTVPDFHRELIETGFIPAADFHITIVQDPKHLSSQVLPVAMKHQIADRIAEHVTWLRARGELEVALSFEAIPRFLLARDTSERLPALREFCMKLDQLRGEQTAAVFPELSALLA